MIDIDDRPDPIFSVLRHSRRKMDISVDTEYANSSMTETEKQLGFSLLLFTGHPQVTQIENLLK
jgi:hypothetical protein